LLRQTVGLRRHARVAAELEARIVRGRRANARLTVVLRVAPRPVGAADRAVGVGNLAHREALPGQIPTAAAAVAVLGPAPGPDADPVDLARPLARIDGGGNTPPDAEVHAPHGAGAA